jgi:hypothetical protein
VLGSSLIFFDSIQRTESSGYLGKKSELRNDQFQVFKKSESKSWSVDPGI